MDLICYAATPFIDLVQNLLNVLWTVFYVFNVSAPDVRTTLNGIFGCVA